MRIGAETRAVVISIQPHDLLIPPPSPLPLALDCSTLLLPNNNPPSIHTNTHITRSYGALRGNLMIAPVVGCPGIGRFVDVRTAWLDECVTDALQGPDGAKQVIVIAAGALGGWVRVGLYFVQCVRRRGGEEPRGA